MGHRGHGRAHTHTHTHTDHRGRGWARLPAEAPSSAPQATGSRCLGTDLRNIAALPQGLWGVGGGWGSKQTPQLSLRPSVSLGAPVRPKFKQPSPPDSPGPHLDGSLFPFHRLQGAWQGSPRTSSEPGVLRWDLSQRQGRRQLRESHQRPISKMQWKTKALELLTGQSLHSLQQERNAGSSSSSPLSGEKYLLYESTPPSPNQLKGKITMKSKL